MSGAQMDLNHEKHRGHTPFKIAYVIKLDYEKLFAIQKKLCKKRESLNNSYYSYYSYYSI